MRRIIRAEGLDREFQGKAVLRDAGFFVEEGEKVGLIGANGSGKTTLLRVITGECRPDSGIVDFKAGLRVVVMQQHFELPPGSKVSDALSSAQELYLLPGVEPKTNSQKIADETWRKLADKLDVTEEMQLRSVSELSGGERTKVSLIRTLGAAKGADLLLLDEPTSHLDIPTMEWLEKAVAGLKCAAVIVSHDRYFLDKTVTRIVELEDCALASHQGNYTDYYTRKENARRDQQIRHAKQQQEIERIESSIKEMRRRWTYDPGRYRGKEKVLEKMELVEAPQEDKGVPAMDFAHESKTGREMAIFDGVTFTRDGRTILENVSFTIENGEKVGLIGANGSGKSTVAKLMMNRLEPDLGRVRIVGRTIPGYFAQEHEGLDKGNTATQEIQKVQPAMQEKTIRGLLAAMRIGREAGEKTVEKLSGGERARLALLKLVLSPTNLLVLDEPTNYLDTQSRQAVEEALLGYEGSILLITHDRYLLDRIATKIFVVDDAHLESFPGNYSAYKTLKRAPLGKKGRNAYVVAKNYTDWGTRTKYKQGQVVELTPEEEEKARWAIDNKVLVPKAD